MNDGEKRLVAQAALGNVIDLTDLPADQRILAPGLVVDIASGPKAKDGHPKGIRIKGAHIVGSLDLSYVEVPHPLGFAMTTFDSRPLLGRCKIPAFELINCSLPGLWADSFSVAYTLMIDSCDVCGTVSMIGASVGADLNWSGSRIVGQEGVALNLVNAEVKGNAYFGISDSSGSGRQFTSIGQVRLVGATVGANLDFHGSILRGAAIDEGSSVEAIVGDGADIGIGMSLRETNIDGEVRFVAAEVGTDIDCSAAVLANRPGDSLTLDGCEIGGNVWLKAGFKSEGGVRLIGAKVGGSLICSDATIESHDTALAADGTAISMALTLQSSRLTGDIRLFNTTAAVLQDDVKNESDLGSWADCRLVLEGFTYGRPAEDVLWKPKTRFAWLGLTKSYEPASWEQLITAYRSVGREDDARSAAIAREEDRLARAKLSSVRRAGRRFLGASIGHGYRPARAGIWALMVIGVFAVIVLVESEKFEPGQTAPDRDPQPVVYAADTFVPVIDFGEANSWTPSGWVQWVEWTVILLGWMLTTLFVAAFTGLVRT